MDFHSSSTREVLGRHGTDARRACAEVTESVVMADDAWARASLETLRDLGVRVAIDDFGTGYSSLAYLHTLPVTTVKVDRSFVERLGGDDDSTPVVRAIVEMSHAMGLRVVAEGVSSERMRAAVAAMGCDLAQGFYWARPMPAAEFAGLFDGQGKLHKTRTQIAKRCARRYGAVSPWAPWRCRSWIAGRGPAVGDQPPLKRPAHSSTETTSA